MEEERQRIQQAIMERLRYQKASHQHRECEEYVGNSIFSKEATIMSGTSDAIKNKREANLMKEKGTKALGDKNYEFAIAFYVDALELALKVHGNEDQIAVLYSNCSYVHCLMKEYDLALQDASFCVQAKPQWYKGPLRMMQAFKAKGIYNMALDIGRQIILKYDFPNHEILTLNLELIDMANLSGNWEHILSMEPGTGLFAMVLMTLVDKNEWSSIKVLIEGKDGMEPVTKSYDVGLLKLNKLLESCSVSDWKKWGERLAIDIIKKGAKKESLDKHGKYPLHAAFSVGMRTGTYELLKHLFLHCIPSADRDLVDQDGNTLLHITCSNTFSTKDTAIALLLSHKLDPKVKNKANKLPIELLEERDISYKLLLKDMKGRGFDILSLSPPRVSPKPLQGPPTTNTQSVTSPHRTAAFQPPSLDTSSSASLCNIPSPDTSISLSLKSYPGLYPKTAIKGSDYTAYKWSPEDVKTWLKDEQLTEIKLPGLSGSHFTGALLVELKMMQNEAPEFFFHLLHDKLQIPFSNLLKISSAIRKLSYTQNLLARQ